MKIAVYTGFRTGPIDDAKKYPGRPELKVEGGLPRPRVEKLVVGGRDRTTWCFWFVRNQHAQTCGPHAPVCHWQIGAPAVRGLRVRGTY